MCLVYACSKGGILVDHSVFVYQKEPVWVLARSIAVCFFKFEDSVGRRVYVDMLAFGMCPWGFVGGTPLVHRGSESLMAPPIKNCKW